MQFAQTMTKRQQELVEAGLRLLDDRGIRKFTMRALAEEIGLSPMAAYKHFDNQLALQLELWRTCMIEFGEALEAGADRTLKEPDAGVLGMCDAFLVYATEHPYRFELLFNHPLIFEALKNRDMELLNDSVWSKGVEAVERGQASGRYREDIPADQVTAMMYAQLHGTANLLIAGRLQRLLSVEKSDFIGLCVSTIDQAYRAA